MGPALPQMTFLKILIPMNRDEPKERKSLYTFVAINFVTFTMMKISGAYRLESKILIQCVLHLKGHSP